MWTGRSKWDKDMEPMGEINVTPLVDVMLVLLIVFMVTAPLLSQGVQVDLPETQAPPLQQDIEPLVITIQRDGSIHLQRHPIALAQLPERIRAMRQQRPDLPVFIRGDAQVPYAQVARVMGALEAAGIRKVGLVTEPIRH